MRFQIKLLSGGQRGSAMMMNDKVFLVIGFVALALAIPIIAKGC